uniref:Thymocyte nuclear protein 1 n=1 Tax=Rhabditophanes sp. KR3021 TaxID=114890 RepID=A0AC35U698_9BILA
MNAKTAADVPKYWLIKSEGDERIVNGVQLSYTIEELENDQTEVWDGVRNYQARNNIREMQKNDYAFFYKSSCKHPAVVGIAQIFEEAVPDVSAEDPSHPNFYDTSKRLDKSNPWFSVVVRFIKKFDSPAYLKDMKLNRGLKDMELVKNSRLSVCKVTRKEWDIIMSMTENGNECLDKA